MISDLHAPFLPPLASPSCRHFLPGQQQTLLAGVSSSPLLSSLIHSPHRGQKSTSDHVKTASLSLLRCFSDSPITNEDKGKKKQVCFSPLSGPQRFLSLPASPALSHLTLLLLLTHPHPSPGLFFLSHFFFFKFPPVPSSLLPQGLSTSAWKTVPLHIISFCPALSSCPQGNGP